jgi:hypothetical protein
MEERIAKCRVLTAAEPIGLQAHAILFWRNQSKGSTHAMASVGRIMTSKAPYQCNHSDNHRLLKPGSDNHRIF